MRLIDADALRDYWRISEPCERCHWNKIDCSKPPYYSLLDICNAIDEIPTEDAIPIEWLNQKYKENDPDGGNEDYDYYMWECSDYIMAVWKEEQEAR